jgi:hypothetical protein
VLAGYERTEPVISADIREIFTLADDRFARLIGLCGAYGGINEGGGHADPCLAGVSAGIGEIQEFGAAPPPAFDDA